MKDALDNEIHERITSESDIARDHVIDIFKSQLYEFENFQTSGDTNTLVMPNGPENSFETWRRLCDQGKCICERPLQDERRALFHVKQANAENFVKAIDNWETRYSDYILQKPDDAMSLEDKFMCLEDVWPEPIQKFIADQHHL